LSAFALVAQQDSTFIKKMYVKGKRMGRIAWHMRGGLYFTIKKVVQTKNEHQFARYVINLNSDGWVCLCVSLFATALEHALTNSWRTCVCFAGRSSSSLARLVPTFLMRRRS
jgi:hypothetical protein